METSQSSGSLCRIEGYAAMGMPERGVGVGRDREGRLLEALWAAAGDDGMDGGVRSVTGQAVFALNRDGDQTGSRGDLRRKGAFGHVCNGDGCVIARHPGPCGFKKRQGLLQAGPAEVPGSSGSNLVPRGDPARACKLRWSAFGTFLTPPCRRGGEGCRGVKRGDHSRTRTLFATWGEHEWTVEERERLATQETGNCMYSVRANGEDAPSHGRRSPGRDRPIVSEQATGNQSPAWRMAHGSGWWRAAGCRLGEEEWEGGGVRGGCEGGS